MPAPAAASRRNTRAGFALRSKRGRPGAASGGRVRPSAPRIPWRFRRSTGAWPRGRQREPRRSVQRLERGGSALRADIRKDIGKEFPGFAFAKFVPEHVVMAFLEAVVGVGPDDFLGPDEPLSGIGGVFFGQKGRAIEGHFGGGGAQNVGWAASGPDTAQDLVPGVGCGFEGVPDRPFTGEAALAVAPATGDLAGLFDGLTAREVGRVAAASRRRDRAGARGLDGAEARGYRGFLAVQRGFEKILPEHDHYDRDRQDHHALDRDGAAPVSAH